VQPAANSNGKCQPAVFETTSRSVRINTALNFNQVMCMLWLWLLLLGVLTFQVHAIKRTLHVLQWPFE
jgi:hypothetical protein